MAWRRHLRRRRLELFLAGDRLRRHHKVAGPLAHVGRHRHGHYRDPLHYAGDGVPQEISWVGAAFLCCYGGADLKSVRVLFASLMCNLHFPLAWWLLVRFHVARTLPFGFLVMICGVQPLRTTASMADAIRVLMSGTVFKYFCVRITWHPSPLAVRLHVLRDQLRPAPRLLSGDRIRCCRHLNAAHQLRSGFSRPFSRLGMIETLFVADDRIVHCRPTRFYYRRLPLGPCVRRRVYWFWRDCSRAPPKKSARSRSFPSVANTGQQPCR